GALGLGLAGWGLGQWFLKFVPETAAKPAPSSSPAPEAAPKTKLTMNKASKWTLAAVIASLAVVLFGDPSIGLFLLLAVLMLGALWRWGPGFLEKQKTAKKQKAILDLFPQSLGMMIQALKSGQTMQQVLEYL